MLAIIDCWHIMCPVILGTCIGMGTLRKSDVSASRRPPLCMYSLKIGIHVFAISILTMPNGLSCSF